MILIKVNCIGMGYAFKNLYYKIVSVANTILAPQGYFNIHER
mgnify:CR=1 FL=1